MKVAILAGNDGSLVNFRGPLIRAIVAEGHEVIAMAPDENSMGGKIAELGARFVGVTLARTGLNPIADWRTRTELCELFKFQQIDLLLAYTIKPVVHGLPAAKRAGVKRRYALITGLGAAFNTRGLKGMLLGLVAKTLYASAFRSASGVMVQNGDIARFLVERRMVEATVPLAIVPGSGVDLSWYVAQQPPQGAPMFLMLSRLLHDKGVVEFVDAARLVKREIPNARFSIAGAHDANPAAIPRELVQCWEREGLVELHAHVQDVRPLLRNCTVCVLPSYHEGMPRSLLEAMATGRPIVTSDVIGCRETVSNVGPPDQDGLMQGVNGFLVPARTVLPLAKAMIRLGKDEALASAMGRAGRALVEARFEVSTINQAMLHFMQLSARHVSSSRC